MDRASADTLRLALEGSDTLVGTVLTLPGAALAELSSAEFDFVWIDLEHGCLDRLQMQEMLIGCSSAGVPALVRVPSYSSSAITAALDAGAAGIVAPSIEDGGQATEFVSRCTYPPHGTRGFGPRRSNLHGLARGVAPEPLLVAQIETAAGLRSASEIANVSGVAALVVGTADLSYNLGVAGQTQSPEVLDALRSVAASAAAAGTKFGIAGPAPDAHLWGTLALDLAVLSTESRTFASSMRQLAMDGRKRLNQAGAPESDSQ